MRYKDFKKFDFLLQVYLIISFIAILLGLYCVVTGNIGELKSNDNYITRTASSSIIIR